MKIYIHSSIEDFDSRYSMYEDNNLFYIIDPISLELVAGPYDSRTEASSKLKELVKDARTPKPSYSDDNYVIYAENARYNRFPSNMMCWTKSKKGYMIGEYVNIYEATRFSRISAQTKANKMNSSSKSKYTWKIHRIN